MLAGSHHATTKKVRDPPAPKLDNPSPVVHIPPLGQPRLHSRDTNSADTLDDDVVAEEPESEVDVVDVAIDEDAAGVLRIVDEEAGRVQLVAGLRADDAWAADSAARAAGVRVAVGGVEAAGEAAEDFEVRVGKGCVDDGLGLDGTVVLA